MHKKNSLKEKKKALIQIFDFLILAFSEAEMNVSFELDLLRGC